MVTLKAGDIRNIALCGHGSAGKTTLADQFLVLSGTKTGHPSVDLGTSFCDFDPEEHKHKHTIEAAVIHFDHNGKRFHVIDTPGYPDFIGHTIGALHGVDTAAIVINAHSGIEVNTHRVFAEAEKAKTARVIIINKMDTDNVEYPRLLDEIRELWGERCLPLNLPIGCGPGFRGVVPTLSDGCESAETLVPSTKYREILTETIIESDEAVLERYFEGTPPTENEIERLLVSAVAAGNLIPIFCCAGKSGVGVLELLHQLVACAVPANLVEPVGTLDGKPIQVHPDPHGPLVARVFKTRIDPFVQKLSFIRVYSGTLKKEMQVHASAVRKLVKFGPLLQVQGSETSHVEEAGPGMIVAVAKMEDLHTGSMLGDITLPNIPFPTPMVGLAVTAKSRGDETKLANALHKVVEEDPTIHLDRDAQTKELVMTGMSELHLGMIRERLQRRDKIEVDTRQPKIPYRETIQAEAEGMYRHKKQSGGRGQFGEVHIRMRPLPRQTDVHEFANKAHFPHLKEFHYDTKSNFLWIDSIVGGTIPGNFMPAIEKGFKERLERGVIAGQQIQDVCVEVHYGKHHPVDSSEAAFKIAASYAFRDVFQHARPSLLEPIVRMSVTVPENHVGDVYSDMSGRRGRVVGCDSAGGKLQTVYAEVPLAEVVTYARTLSSMTGGQGSYSMEFSHYDVVPPNIQAEIVAKAKPEAEEESE